MAEQRKRWFQVSLTTCILMMIVAGALMWANMAYRWSTISGFSADSFYKLPQHKDFPVGICGWPFCWKFRVNPREDFEITKGKFQEEMHSIIDREVELEMERDDLIARKSDIKTAFIERNEEESNSEGLSESLKNELNEMNKKQIDDLNGKQGNIETTLSKLGEDRDALIKKLQLFMNLEKSIGDGRFWLVVNILFALALLAPIALAALLSEYLSRTKQEGKA